MSETGVKGLGKPVGEIGPLVGLELLGLSLAYTKSLLLSDQVILRGVKSLTRPFSFLPSSRITLGLRLGVCAGLWSSSQPLSPKSFLWTRSPGVIGFLFSPEVLSVLLSSSIVSKERVGDRAEDLSGDWFGDCVGDWQGDLITRAVAENKDSTSYTEALKLFGRLESSGIIRCGRHSCAVLPGHFSPSGINARRASSRGGNDAPGILEMSNFMIFLMLWELASPLCRFLAVKFEEGSLHGTVTSSLAS